jgi:hypothetical protein
MNIDGPMTLDGLGALQSVITAIEHFTKCCRVRYRAEA